MNQYNYGTDATLVLTLVFILLRVTGVIDWPWIWVLSPIWIGLLVGLFVLLLLIILVVIDPYKVRK